MVPQPQRALHSKRAWFPAANNLEVHAQQASRRSAIAGMAFTVWGFTGTVRVGITYVCQLVCRKITHNVVNELVSFRRGLRQSHPAARLQECCRLRGRDRQPQGTRSPRVVHDARDLGRVTLRLRRARRLRRLGRRVARALGIDGTDYATSYTASSFVSYYAQRITSACVLNGARGVFKALGQAKAKFAKSMTAAAAAAHEGA